MFARLLASAAICTAAPLLALAPTADASSASSASVVGEASCLYGGPSWMSSWSVSSEFPFSVYGSGLERTHQFDEVSATLEVLVNTGSSVDPVHELVAVTIDRPEGCDGTTPEPVVEVEPVGVRAPVVPAADTSSASSASVVGEASCLYGGPSWMSSWSVSSEFPFSVYGSGLERTHQFDEVSATLEVLVNTGSSVDPVHELVAVTIDRPEGCDGTTPEPVVEVEPVGVRAPVVPAADASSASSASVVGEASCLYGGPSWMSSWSVSSEFPFSVYGSGLERTHQFDEVSATLEVLVNTGSSVDPVHELVAVTIDRPEGCDGTTPEPVVEVEPAIEPKLVIESEPIPQAAMVVESTFSQASDEDDRSDRDESDSDEREDRRDDRRDAREDRRDEREDRRDDRRDEREDRRDDRRDAREDRRDDRRDARDDRRDDRRGSSLHHRFHARD